MTTIYTTTYYAAPVALSKLAGSRHVTELLSIPEVSVKQLFGTVDGQPKLVILDEVGQRVWCRVEVFWVSIAVIHSGSE